MDFRKLFSNPVVKTVLSTAAGAAAVAVDQALQNPTGDTLQALQANPTYAMVFTTAALFVHNLVSKMQFAPKDGNGH